MSAQVVAPSQKGPFAIPSWTVFHAISLLQESEDPITLECLDHFLKLHKPVFRQPLPFESSANAEQEIKKVRQDIELRTVKYPVTEQNKKDATKVATLLKLDVMEVLRVISQLSAKIPDNNTVGRSSFRIGDNADDLSDMYESERIQMYTSNVLRERRSFLKATSLLLQARHNELVSTTVQGLSEELSMDLDFATLCVEKFEALVNSITLDRSSPSGSEIDDLVLTETSLLVVDLLKVLINLYINSVVDKALVLHWFKIMTKTNFLACLSGIVAQDTLASITALASIASLLLIDLDSNYGDLADDISYMNDPKIFHEITLELAKTPTNPLILYAWSIALHRKYLSIQSSPSNPVAIQIVSQFDNDLENLKFYYTAFASKADENGVCSAIVQCTEILKSDSMYVAILGSFVISMLPYVELTPKVASAIATVMADAPPAIVKRFFSDDQCERLVILSRAKLPLSLASYIKLCNINGVFAYEEFSVLKSYMEVFKELDLFNKYEFDEFNPELVQFNENIDVYPPYEKPGELSLLLEKGIKGKLIASPEENQQIVIFLYEYNGLSLIGRVLQNLSRTYGVNDSDKNELTIDILKLITRILQQCPKAVQEDTITVMSAFVDPEDIFAVIFQLFDNAVTDRNIELLVPLMSLLTAALESFPEKVWSYLDTSTLVKNGSKGNVVSIILGAIETVHGNYDFTIAVIDLCRGLISNCLNVTNKTSPALRQEILGRLILHLVQIFESFNHWKYTELYQKAKIGTLVSDIFSRILVAAYGIGENSNIRDKPTKVFTEAAETVVDSFLKPTSPNSRANGPILAMIESITVGYSSYESSENVEIWFDNWSRSAFEFATLLITTRSILGLQPSKFEESIFSQAKNLVHIYAQFVSLRKYVIKLLTSLVAAKWPNEPPSLLAYLGTHHSRTLMNSMVVDLENSLDDYQMKISIYDFFSAVMDGNFQEGLAIIFITGRDIRDTVDSKDTKAVKSRSILSVLKKQISQIYQYPETVGLHLVEAIAFAFNSWTTAKEDGADKEFISELINRVKSTPKMVSVADGLSSEELVSRSYEFKLVSKIAEILALYLFVLKNEECVKLIENLISDEQFLDTVASYFSIQGFEPLLQSDLHKKFETKWPNFKLLQFVKSTLVKTRRYGVGSVYDISLMDELFKQEEEWESYRDGITTTSINLCYMEAQITAAKCFGALLTSYCSKTSKPLGTQFLKLVGNLLDFGEVDESIASSYFGEVRKERVELAFFITYKSSAQTAVDDEFLLPILTGCSNVLLSNDLDLITGFAEGDTAQYRPMLRTVLIALRMIKPSSQLLTNYSGVSVDLFNLIISKGSRYLFLSIQNEALSNYNKPIQDSAVIQHKMADVVLILSILKTFVKLPLTHDIKARMSESLVEHGAIRAILNLFSCSHIIRINEVPVFAELTLVFIQELISVREVAEKFLSNGLFSVLVESPISALIQKGGIRSNVAPNYHHIWTNGLLSVLLTLLSIFGDRVISETVMFVTYFIKQFETNINCWFQDSVVITNAAIQETNQIVLLYKVLQALNISEYLLSFHHNGAADSDTEEIKFIPGLDTVEERQGLINVFNYLLSHPKFLSMRISPITPEENRLSEQDAKKFFDGLVANIRDLKLALSE